MKKVLGTRFLYQTKKSEYAALILLAVFGIFLTIVPAMGLIPLPFIAFGILCLVLPIISYFTTIWRIKKCNEKVKNLPTIELSSPDTFTAYLYNGKVVDIKLSDISQIKSNHRTTVNGGWAGFYKVTTFEDGSIKFILKDKTKITVKYVDKVDEVADILLKLTRNPQAAEELFNAQDNTQTTSEAPKAE